MDKETLEEVAENRTLKCIPSDYFSFIAGADWQAERSYSEEDMINASKYGYDYHKTSQFPEQQFEDSCIRNTQQWLTTFKKNTLR